MNRRSFAKRGVVACAALLGSTSSLTAATEKTNKPKGLTELTESSRPADLEFEVPFLDEHRSTRRPAHCRVRVPGLEVIRPRLHPKTSKARVLLSVHFMSRSVKVANLEIELLEEMYGRRVLYRTSRREELGPERVVIPGKNIPKVSRWDDHRALWFDFPKEAGQAKAIRVKVRLERA